MGERVDAVGDDCAIVHLGGPRVAIGTDLAVEGRHFRIGWISHYEAGWRAAVAALSDIAAVAALPRGVLVSLGVPVEWPHVFVEDVADGVADAAESVGARVWGGDLVQSDPAIIDVTVVGEARSPVLRSGAAQGEGVWVTGVLGGPRVALGAWLSGSEPEESARERFARPVARVREAVWLGERGATAMIDVSDGLVGDAGHVAAASGAAIVLESERVPVHPAAGPEDALSGGEEFELLVTLPPAVEEGIAQRFEEEFGLRLTKVGVVEAGSGVTLLRGGSPIEVPAAYSHF